MKIAKKLSALSLAFALVAGIVLTATDAEAAFKPQTKTTVRVGR